MCTRASGFSPTQGHQSQQQHEGLWIFLDRKWPPTALAPSLKGTWTGLGKTRLRKFIFFLDPPRLSKTNKFWKIWLGEFVWVALDFGYIKLVKLPLKKTTFAISCIIILLQLTKFSWQADDANMAKMVLFEGYLTKFMQPKSRAAQTYSPSQIGSKFICFA